MEKWNVKQIFHLYLSRLAQAAELAASFFYSHKILNNYMSTLYASNIFDIIDNIFDIMTWHDMT